MTTRTPGRHLMRAIYQNRNIGQFPGEQNDHGWASKGPHIVMKISFQNYMIRSWNINDSDSLQKYADNRKIWLNLRDSFPHPYTADNAKQWVLHASRQIPERSFAIAKSIEAIGGIGLVLGEDIHRCSTESGYWLAEPF